MKIRRYWEREIEKIIDDETGFAEPSSKRIVEFMIKEIGEAGAKSDVEPLVSQSGEAGSKGGPQNAGAVCTWTAEDDEGDTYETDCGNLFQFFSDSPLKNGFVYCPYCGKKLVEG